MNPSSAFAGPVVHVDVLELLAGKPPRGGQARLVPVRFRGEIWLFKQYNQKTLAELDPDALIALVQWRTRLDDRSRAYLDSVAAWPRHVVVTDEGPAGVLQPLAAPEFLEDASLEHLKARHLSRVTRPFEPGRPYFEMPEKLARLGHLGEVMAFLHARGVVVGDLQPQNVLTTAAGGEAKILLIDCDSVVLQGKSAFPQVDPGHYKPPSGRSFDRVSDYYKLAVLSARCLEEDNSVDDCRDGRALLVLRSTDLAMLRRCLDEQPLDADTPAWRNMLRVWRGSVSREGELSYRNDDFVKQIWPGVELLASTTVDRGTPPEPPTDMKGTTGGLEKPPTHQKSTWRRGLAVTGAAVVLLTGGLTANHYRNQPGPTPMTNSAAPSSTTEAVTFYNQPNGTCFNSYFGRDSLANGPTLGVVRCSSPLARLRLIDYGATDEMLPECQAFSQQPFSGNGETYCFENVFQAGLCVPGYDVPGSSVVYLNYGMDCRDTVTAAQLGAPADAPLRNRKVDVVTALEDNMPCAAGSKAYDIQESLHRVCLEV